jgi:type I restriction enzyme S subunit
LRTDPAINEIKRFSRGITDFRLRLYWDEFKNLRVCLPPAIERDALLRFLDRETAKIDALIAEQQRLIELLQEKRQAVISHAVTKGLNPDAPMKDSGVEWLGEVPEHWEVGALGYALSAIGDVDHYMPPTVAEGVPYVMTGDLEDLASEIDFTACKQISRNEYHQLCKKIITSKGDLIVARYATIGTVSYVDLDLEFIVSYSCVTIRPKAEKAFGRFLFFCLKSDSFFQGIRERINTNTQGNVGIADLKLVKVALPPIEKQLEITEFLQTRTEEMGRVIQSSEAVIDLLQERRSALISAAVTGQIDVRGLVPEAVAA